MERDSKVTHYEWCRAFIDRYCIFRSPPDGALLTSKEGWLNTWQFYMPVAMLDQTFAQYIALLFWEHFESKLPFQLCACESGGIPLMSALQARNPVNGFVIKKQAKAYGLKNWLEGVVYPDVPVLLIDDVVGKKKTLTTQAKRLVEFDLLVKGAFAIAACKLKPPLSLELEHNVGTLTLPLKTFYGPDDFVKSHTGYIAKYGKNPQFYGTVV